MTPKGSGASCAHEVENISARPAKRGMHCQHPEGEATAGHGMRSIANLPHDDAVTNYLFGTIVRRFDSLEVNEGPTCVATLEQHSARLARFSVRALRAFHEQCFEAPLDGPHVNAERRARQ